MKKSPNRSLQANSNTIEDAGESIGARSATEGRGSQDAGTERIVALSSSFRGCRLYLIIEDIEVMCKSKTHIAGLPEK